jgi:hypothetical protein
LARFPVIDQVLDQRLAGTLSDPAKDLALDQHRIDHRANVVDSHVADECDKAGEFIDLNFTDMRSIGPSRSRAVISLFAEASLDMGRQVLTHEAFFATSMIDILRSVPATTKLPFSNTMSVSAASRK